MKSSKSDSGRWRAAWTTLLPILGISVSVAWIEALLYTPKELPFIVKAWVLALDGSLTLFFALPVAILWAAAEAFLPERWLKLAGPERMRRVTAIGLAWALWPTLSLILPQRGVTELLAVVAMTAGIRLICRWLPPVHLGASGIMTACGALLLYGLSASTETDLKLSPIALPEVASAGQERDQRPCILLISADTLRDDRVGAVRDGRQVTPFLDSLAAQGRRELCVSSSNQTGPGHASMLTGASILRHGVIGNGMVVQESIVTLAELLRQSGWRTAGVVSNHVLESVGGYARGFEVYGDLPKTEFVQSVAFFGLKQHGSRWRWLLLQPDWTLAWLRLAELNVHLTPKILQPRADQIVERARPILTQLESDPHPFLLFAHFMDPHHPFDSPPETRGTWTRPEELRGIPLRTIESFQVFRDAVELRSQQGSKEAFVTGEILERLYDEEILAMDHWIERLYAEAKQAAGDRPLWLLFTSDHGEHFLEYGLLGHANSLYEELIRVPLIVHGVPDMNAPDFPERLEDIPPFLLRRALGDSAEKAIALLREGSPVLSPGGAISVWGKLASYREPPWKLILSADRFMGEYTPVMLYDITSAEGEHKDVAAAHPEVTARLHAAFTAAQKQSMPVVHKPLSREMAERLARMLAELGYVDATE